MTAGSQCTSTNVGRELLMVHVIPRPTDDTEEAIEAMIQR